MLAESVSVHLGNADFYGDATCCLTIIRAPGGARYVQIGTEVLMAGPTERYSSGEAGRDEMDGVVSLLLV
jgi:hypothetical protein